MTRTARRGHRMLLGCCIYIKKNTNFEVIHMYIHDHAGGGGGGGEDRTFE